MSVQIRIQDNRKEIKEHGDYAFPVNVCVETIQQYEQGSFLWHWHPEIELTWIMSGEMEYRVNDSVYYLKEGEGLFGNSNTLHSGYQVDGKNCSYLSVTFHPRFLYGYESGVLQTKYVNFITENDGWASLKLEREVGWQREVMDQMKMIYGLVPEETVDYELQVHILLLEIWQKFYRYFHALPEQKGRSQNSLQRLRNMIGYLQEHYDQNVSLEDVAGQVNICKSECCRFFKKHMNMTIMEYLMYLRIQNSLPLLRRGESITRTAQMAGFSSSAYYGQIFKRYMKCTPGEYRARKLV